MTFDPNVKQVVQDYVWGHIPAESWHLTYFDFIDDQNLARRLGEEFMSARTIYKMLEGFGAKDWLQRAQIRAQILSYASIYEASIHHLLFVNLAEDADVIALVEFPMRKQISIPSISMAALAEHLEHDGKTIIPTYEGVGKTDESKVRFDRKAECAYKLGLIEDWLRDELIEFYEARNSIHIHAEIRKSLNYEIDLSRRAYMRLEPFKDQIRKWQHDRTV